METIVDRVRALCKQQGTSLTKLEAELGLGNGIIGRWAEAVPRYDKIKMVADYFDVSTDYLATGTEKAATQKGGGHCPEAEVTASFIDTLPPDEREWVCHLIRELYAKLKDNP